MQYIIRNTHENYTAINNAFLQDSKESRAGGKHHENSERNQSRPEQEHSHLGYVRGVCCERGIVWQANITTSN